MLGLNTALHATRQGLHHWSSSPWDVTDFWASYLVALVCASVFSHYYPVFITIAFHIFSSQKLWCLQICSSCSKILKLVMLIGGSALVKTDFYFCKKCQQDLKESHQVCHSCLWCGQFVFLFPVFMHVHMLLDVCEYTCVHKHVKAQGCWTHLFLLSYFIYRGRISESNPELTDVSSQPACPENAIFTFWGWNYRMATTLTQYLSGFLGT